MPLPTDVTFRDQLFCEQSNRRSFLDLELTGYQVVPQLPENEQQNQSDFTKFDGAIILAGRVRKVNEQNIRRAWDACADGADIIIAGEKTSGINSLRKWLGNLVDISGSVSKFHALAFWVTKKNSKSLYNDEPAHIDENPEGYEISPGMFSSDGSDVGSKLLCEHFDNRIRGKIADFGAGWGYLSTELNKRSEKIESLDLYEADWLSLEAAKNNLSECKFPCSFHWIDLVKELKKKPFEWIIMNPPFHQNLQTGRAAEPMLGQSFIQIAASTLIQGGKLLMVANRNLPYEKTLEKCFRRHVVLADRDAYKVFEATK